MDANSLIRFLFKWWLIVSGTFWGLIGIVHFTLAYMTYRLTGQWPLWPWQ